MDIKELKLYAASVIVESDLSKASKIQLLNFIKEQATDSQIKAFILDGQIVSLDEQAEKIVDDRFASLNEVVEIGAIALGGLAAMFGAAFLAQATKSIRRIMTAAGSKCKHLAGKEYNKCMDTQKIMAEEAKLKVLQQALSKCDKTKDPSKCHIKVSKMIESQKNKITRIKAGITTAQRMYGHAE